MASMPLMHIFLYTCEADKFSSWQQPFYVSYQLCGRELESDDLWLLSNAACAVAGCPALQACMTQCYAAALHGTCN